MKDKETQNNVFDILDKMEFFQGQRAGRELWNDKPKEVQDKDISDFIKDINYIRSYLQDSVVLSREEYEKLKSLYDTQKGAYMTSSIGDLPLTVKGLRKAVDEITRLNRVETELQELNIKYYNVAKDLRRELKQSHKETAKEFAEKLKNKLFDFFQDNEELDGKISVGVLYVDVIGVEAKDGTIISLGLIDELLKEYVK